MSQKQILQNPQFDNFLQQQLNSLLKQRQQQQKRNQLTYKNVSIWSEANYKPSKIVQNNKHKFNIYADKLLIHLVIEQTFDFEKIADILNYTFNKQGLKFTSKICSERWHQIHRDRQLIHEIKQKQMENKRIKSIMSMTDPFILYNIEQKLNKMQKQQKSNNSNQQNQTNIQHNSSSKSIQQYRYQGYNIFKDSIRRIDDMQKYRQLQQQMKQALQKASKQIQIQKPMLYSPYYQRLQYFQVLEQQLTIQKMQKMLSHPIQMEVVERQLKAFDLNQNNFQSKVKKQAEKKIRQEKIKNQEMFQIQDNWDQYQSD